MIQSLGLISNPADILLNLRQQSGESCAYFHFNHVQTYSRNEKIPVGVICYSALDQLRVAISADHDLIQRTLQAGEEFDPEPSTPAGRKAKEKSSSEIRSAGVQTELREIYRELVIKTGIADIDLMSPLRLDTVTIAKPWGQEIWYTGIEARGVCSVQNVPLPWILELGGSLLTGKKLTGTESPTPILLKILDPHPREVVGDLYFELHKEKREVYIVTNIDQGAWPDSVGKIRYGFNPEKMKSYKDEQQFKSAYLSAVNEYKTVRNKIDSNPYEIDPDKIDPQLIEKEKSLRNAMDEYTLLKSLIVGDVIQVQPFTPHSLQHGVRVIEFQTPHYERFILSFAQKVLTQDHWDTEEAMQCVRFNEPDETEPTAEKSLVADFEEFSVTRLALEPGTDSLIEGNLTDRNVYRLIIGVQGEAHVNNMKLLPEEGCYIPACVETLNISNTGPDQATVLIAQPKS